MMIHLTWIKYTLSTSHTLENIWTISIDLATVTYSGELNKTQEIWNAKAREVSLEMFRTVRLVDWDVSLLIRIVVLVNLKRLTPPPSLSLSLPLSLSLSLSLSLDCRARWLNSLSETRSSTLI